MVTNTINKAIGQKASHIFKCNVINECQFKNFHVSKCLSRLLGKGYDRHPHREILLSFNKILSCCIFPPQQKYQWSPSKVQITAVPRKHVAYADAWMKNPARFILEYCQLKHFHVTTNYYRNCRKCLNQKLWPQSDSFSYRATLKSLKTLHYSIIVLL